MIDLNRFTQYAQTYGGELRRWPPDVREEAAGFARAPEALQVLNDARALDAFLGDALPLAPSSALEEALSRIPGAPQRGIVWIWRPYKSALALALCVAFGLLSGIGTSEVAGKQANQDAAAWVVAPDHSVEY